MSSTARPRYTAEYVTELFYFGYVALSANRLVRELSCPRTGCPRIGLSAKSLVTESALVASGCSH